MVTEHRQSDQGNLPVPPKIERTREETEALLAEVRRNREERMHGRRNVTDSAKIVRQMREGRSYPRTDRH